jgi:hypothetical protein
MKKLLFAVYLVFLTFLVGSAVFASRTFDGDIRNSFEKGMAYPLEKAKIKEKGWSFSINQKLFSVDRQSKLEILITDEYRSPIHGAKVSMEISRLTQPYTLPLQQAFEQETGHYITSVSLPSHGHWQVIAGIEIDDELVHHQFNIYAEESQKK